MTIAPAPTLQIRQSHVVLYDSCPKALEIERRMPDFDTHQQARGTVFHEFAYRVVKNCHETGETTMPPGFARDLMVQCIRESGLIITALEHDQLLGLATEFVSSRTFDTRDLLDLEETYSIEVLGVTITGHPDRMDLVGDVLEIRDYKTGWAIDPDAALRGTPQGRIYARMAFNEYPQISAVRLMWDYPRWGAAPREVTLTRNDLPDIDTYLESLIVRYVLSVRDDEWKASPGTWCQYCPDSLQCPIPKEFRGEGSVVTPEDALAAGELVLALDAQRKQTTKALRAYGDANGPIPVGNGEFGFKLRADTWELIDRDALRLALATATVQLKAAAEAGVIDADAIVDLDWETHYKPKKGYTEFRHRKPEKPKAVKA